MRTLRLVEAALSDLQRSIIMVAVACILNSLAIGVILWCLLKVAAHTGMINA